MNKAILVMDMPKGCESCPLFNNNYQDMHCRFNHESIGYPYPRYFRQEWCPLKELPEKEEGEYLREWTNGYKTGWNDYREAVLEEEYYEND